MPALHRHRRVLRTALLLLLALGMVVQPTLGALSELHHLEHAASASADDLHGHAHAADPDHAHGGDRSDPEHVAGTHGLLHQGPCAAVALPVAVTALAPPTLAGPCLFESGPPRRPGEASSLPFRPPIA